MHSKKYFCGIFQHGKLGLGIFSDMNKAVLMSMTIVSIYNNTGVEVLEGSNMCLSIKYYYNR